MIIIFLPPAVDAKHIPPTGLIYTGFVRITCYIDEGRLGQFRFKLGNRFCSRKNKIKVSKMKWRAWPSYISRMCLTKGFSSKSQTVKPFSSCTSGRFGSLDFHLVFVVDSNNFVVTMLAFSAVSGEQNPSCTVGCSKRTLINLHACGLNSILITSSGSCQV